MLRIIGIIFCSVLFIVLAQSAHAQFPFENPECVTFDTLNNRYLVSSCGDDAIYSLYSDGRRELFWQDDGIQVLGNCIGGDTFYVSIDYNPSAVVAFDLNTDQLLYELVVAGSRQLDGMTTDSSGHLFIGDGVFNRVYRVDLSDLSYDIYFAGTAVAGIQDIEFDPVNNRILTIGFNADSKLLALNLNSGSYQILVDPPVGQFDGLAVDNEGNYYLSSWQTDIVYRYGPGLTNPPEALFSFPSGAANIEFNSRDDILILPMFDMNEVILMNLYADFSVDQNVGPAPLTANFEASSVLYETVDDWSWVFGDGQNGGGQSIQHVYTEPGLYDITVTADHGGEFYEYSRPSFILVTADSLYGGEESGINGESVPFELYAVNTQPLERLRIPISYSGACVLHYDSFSTAGLRSEAMPVQNLLYADDNAKRLMLNFEGDLAAGTDPIATIYFTIDPASSPGNAEIRIEDHWPDIAEFYTWVFSYPPVLGSGSIQVLACGDVDLNGKVNILDIVYLVTFKFQGGPPPSNPDLADVNNDGRVDILDIVYLVNYKFKSGPSPEC